mmetsp:Transcript_485/g.992  ORF Transcript_485/g.992 Transcript_485/m.992 type:complete len:408 (+) Transcript_485:14-1237(+)
MAIVLKQTFLVFVALLLVVLPQAVDARIRGVRGVALQEFDSVIPSKEKTPSSERNLRRKRKMRCSQKISGSRASRYGCKEESAETPNDSSSTIGGRLDIPVKPAVTLAPLQIGPSVAKWVEGCPREDSVINTCTPFSNSICKKCLFGLSWTSVTPASATSGIKACARDYCDGCTSDELMPFFDCGWKVSNPDEAEKIDTTEGVMPNSEIRTPPPASNTTEETHSEDDENGIEFIDLVNCPAIYPKSGTECTMLDGFEYKLCKYFELGPDVACQCSRSQPKWNCAGSIIRNPSAVTEDLQTVIEEENELIAPALPGADIVVIEEENELQMVFALPESDVVVSRVEDTTSKGAEPLCPVERPWSGTTCTTGGFHQIGCCYPSDTLGTITCTCDGESWDCKGGSLSTCKL